MVTIQPALSTTRPSIAHMAPADKYFGRLRLSYLGINNTFTDATHAAGDYTTDNGIPNKVDFAMESLNDWQNQYPRDSHLARSYFLGQLSLKKIWIRKYQDKAWAYMQRLIGLYPTTYFGKAVKADLARGFTENYFADPIPCEAASLPKPEPTTLDNGKYKIAIHPAPCIEESPTPEPAPSAIPATSDSPGASESPTPSSDAR
ncbi:MAG: hypothetical protein ABI346_05305 [Candidatus Baltobacteraceae bacterium]